MKNILDSTSAAKVTQPRRATAHTPQGSDLLMLADSPWNSEGLWVSPWTGKAQNCNPNTMAKKNRMADLCNDGS